MTQFLLNGFFGSNRILVVAVSTGLPMFYNVLLSNEKLLLLRGKIAPPQLILADPCEGFFSAFKSERHGGKVDFRVLLEDGIAVDNYLNLSTDGNDNDSVSCAFARFEL